MATAVIPGFPEHFPVLDRDAKSLRYRTVSMMSRALLRSLFGGQLQIEGGGNLPEQGPVLVVSNHLSNLDPFIFGGFSVRPMFCMAKQEIFHPRVAAWMLAGCNCFPVDRGAADRGALRTSLDILQRGGRLLIFLEGTRAKSPGMKRAEAGIGFLARRSRSPVLPVAVWGTEQALRRGRLLPRRVPVHMRWGTAEPVSDLVERYGRDDQAIADGLATRIASLLPEPYRGVYGPAVEAA